MNKNLESLAERILILHESGAALFLFVTNYDEDLERLIQLLSGEYGIFDREREILEIRQEWLSDWQGEDIFYYRGGRVLEENSRRQRVGCTQLTRLRSLYLEPPTGTEYLAQALECLAALKDQHRVPAFPLLVIRNGDSLLARDTEGTFARALYRVGRAKAVDHSVKLLIFMTVTESFSNSSLPGYLLPFVHMEEIPPLSEENIRYLIQERSRTEGMSLAAPLLDKLVLYLKGFRESEIQRIMQYALLKGDPFKNEGRRIFEIISREKKQMVLKSGGLLEWIEEDQKKIGGLEAARGWLEKKAVIYEHFDVLMRKGMELPKGMLIAGIPGSGKSLLAKTARKIFRLPLLKLDMGRLMGGLVGESERNMRKALSLVRDMSPCVLWVDELEKAFAGAGEDGHEVTIRLFGSFLTWMQDKDFPCFIMATANQVSSLRPEFLRKGRFDEKFFTFMPMETECISIFKACLMRQKNCIRWKDIGTPVREGDIVGRTSGRLSRGEEEELELGLRKVLDAAASFPCKFMTGADIQSVVSQAFEDLYLAALESDPEALFFTVDELSDKLIQALAQTKTYGETDLENIGRMWIEMKKHNFLPAAGRGADLIPFEEFSIQTNSFGETFRNGEGLDSLYDRKMRNVICQEIERQIAE